MTTPTEFGEALKQIQALPLAHQAVPSEALRDRIGNLTTDEKVEIFAVYLEGSHPLGNRAATILAGVLPKLPAGLHDWLCQFIASRSDEHARAEAVQAAAPHQMHLNDINIHLLLHAANSIVDPDLKEQTVQAMAPDRLPDLYGFLRASHINFYNRR